MGVKIGKKKTAEKAVSAKTEKKVPRKKSGVAGASVVKLEAGDENPLPLSTPMVTEAVEFHGEGDSFFHVIKGNHSAIVKADSKGEARETFMTMFGILDTAEKVQIGEVDEDQLDKFNLNKDGVILDL